MEVKNLSSGIHFEVVLTKEEFSHIIEDLKSAQNATGGTYNVTDLFREELSKFLI